MGPSTLNNLHMASGESQGIHAYLRNDLQIQGDQRLTPFKFYLAASTLVASGPAARSRENSPPRKGKRIEMPDLVELRATLGPGTST